jgi:hypothetical protein
MTLSHRVFHPYCQGQCAGRCSIGLRAGAAKRAGTLTRSRRRVAPRATAWLPPTRVPAARSRLCAITAQPSQAQFAANSPEVIFSSLVARPVYLLRCVVVSVADVAVNRVR